MSFKKFTILLFLACSISGVVAQEPPAFYDSIPFRNDLGLIIIPMTFNGEVKHLAFDTGAQISVAYGWAKEELKRTSRTLNVNSSSGLRSKMRFYKSKRVGIGSQEITNYTILNAPRNEIFTCYKVDGILGVDLIQQFNWVIDYKNKMLKMYPKTYFPEEVQSMSELAFDFTGSRPYVFLKAEQQTYKFLLDTGAGGISNISKRNYPSLVTTQFKNLLLHTGSRDVNGILTYSNPIVLEFYKTQSKDTQISPILYYDNKKSSKIANSLWSDKQIFISLSQDKLYVSESEIIEEYKSYACAVSITDNTMVIIKINEDTAIWDAGIRQGDEVALINDQKFDNFCSLDNYQRGLVRSGESFTVEMADGQRFTISKQKSFQE